MTNEVRYAIADRTHIPARSQYVRQAESARASATLNDHLPLGPAKYDTAERDEHGGPGDLEDQRVGERASGPMSEPDVGRYLNQRCPGSVEKERPPDTRERNQGKDHTAAEDAKDDGDLLDPLESSSQNAERLTRKRMPKLTSVAR
jgi:hypothetical protein